MDDSESSSVQMDCCIDTLVGSETSPGSKTSTDIATKIKAASAPVVPQTPSQEAEVRAQISAPSYLNCLRENDEPPFRKPDREPKPCIITGTIMNEAEAVAMIAAADIEGDKGLRQFLGKLALSLLGDFLVEKNIIANYFLSEKNFLISFLMETIDYAAQRQFDAHRLSTLITIYLSTHLYFKWYYWQSPTAVWTYFRDLMKRHSIDDTPDGEEVFEACDCYDIVSHFHTVYLSNLPLVHIATFGSQQVKLLWPFKAK